MPVAVIVNWYGPYTNFKDFKDAMKDWSKKERTLYMAFGLHNKIRYIGMTENPRYRPYGHLKLQHPRNKTFYTGNIVTQGISGRRLKKHAPDLTIAEHLLIFSLKPELNAKLKNTIPSDCISVFSQFFRIRDEDEPHYPLPKFPSLIAFNSWTEEIVRT